MSENMPAPLLRGSIDDLIEDGADQNVRTAKVFIGHNLGHRTFSMVMGMREFYDQSMVANEMNEHGEITQRKLDEEHAFKLAKYLLSGAVDATIGRYERNGRTIPEALNKIASSVGRPPYSGLQPFVANLRSCKAEGLGFPAERLISRFSDETTCFKVALLSRDILWVVDGQHRRAAMDLMFRFLSDIAKACKYPKKTGKNASLYDYEERSLSNDEWRMWCEIQEVAASFMTVTVEVHLGLSFVQERQFFHDLNTKGKKVERSLALSFDSVNPINTYVREVLGKKPLVGAVNGSLGPILQICDTDRKDWTIDDGKFPLKDLVAINSMLMLNKSSASAADAKTVNAREAVATDFWRELALVVPGWGAAGQYQQTIAAQSVVMKALAKLVFDFAFGRKANEIYLKDLLLNFGNIDFSHNNPMWRYYELTDAERQQYNLTTLHTYLPKMKKDIGRFDQGKMRFGTAHNDIYPVIGDMIRWKLHLPPR
jgi:hypothetical protein